MSKKDNNPKSKWYIIQVIPNHELVVKEDLENKDFDSSATEGIKQVFLPFTIATTKTGNKKKRPMFPGYIFLNALMTDNTWYVIRNTQYVTGIVGSSGQRTKPTPIPDSQIESIIKRIETEQLEVSTSTGKRVESVEYKVGDIVTILDGNFKDKFGKVIELSMEKQIAIVELEFFGRMSPITLPLLGLAKRF